MIKKRLIVVYSRVSSATQSIELQEAAARRYLESQSLTGNENFIVYLSDTDVSATKYKMNERPKLMKLLRLIEEGKVKTVIGYKRDRFARNFYEFVDITNIFIKHNVEVIYTASNESLFKDKLSLEAFHGMFGQMEAENIRTRTDDARKQYPSRILGYKRKRKDGRVTFLIDNTKKELIVTLFNDFCNVSNEEQFINLLLARRVGLTDPNRILRILTNPFYSAHYKTNHGYQLLPHVEPIINLETFLTVKSIVDKFIVYYEEKLQDINNLVKIIPRCGECNGFMKHRRANPLDFEYFVCRDRHRRVAISVEEANNLITQTVLNHIKSISVNQAEKVILKKIRTESGKLQIEKKKAVSRYLDNALMISTHDKNNKVFIHKYLDKIRSLKEQYYSISDDILALQELRDEIKNIKRLTKLNFNFSQHELQQLIDLLVDKVYAHEDYMQITLYLSVFEKDKDVS